MAAQWPCSGTRSMPEARCQRDFRHAAGVDDESALILKSFCAAAPYLALQIHSKIFSLT